jgi:uncharacterized membrane protein (UPF0127 family)
MLEGKAHFIDMHGIAYRSSFNIKKTETTLERTRGLLGANKLADAEGLWISPCNSVHTFGMTYPLDIVYLDKKLRVKKITTNLKPRRVSFNLLASSVIELKAGTAEKLPLKKGDTLHWVAYE